MLIQAFAIWSARTRVIIITQFFFTVEVNCFVAALLLSDFKASAPSLKDLSAGYHEDMVYSNQTRISKANEEVGKKSVTVLSSSGSSQCPKFGTSARRWQSDSVIPLRMRCCHLAPPVEMIPPRASIAGYISYNNERPGTVSKDAERGIESRNHMSIERILSRGCRKAKNVH